MFHEIAMLDASARGAWDGTQVDAGFCVVKESRQGETNKTRPQSKNDSLLLYSQFSAGLTQF